MALLWVGLIMSCVSVGQQREWTMQERAEQWPVETVVYKSSDHGDLSLHVRKPRDWRPEDRRAAIIFFFGGGWNAGSPTQFAPQAAYFAERGLVTFCADYRVKSRHGVMADVCVQDAKSAMRYLRGHARDYGIDPHRIVAAGGSAGGHLALCCAFIQEVNNPADDLSISPVPDAVIGFNPVPNLVDIERPRSRIPDSETALSISPRHHLRAEAPPLLIFIGTRDLLYDFVLDFVAEAGRFDNRVELCVDEGQPHGYFNRSPWLERTTLRANAFLTSLGYFEEDAARLRTDPIVKDQ